MTKSLESHFYYLEHISDLKKEKNESIDEEMFMQADILFSEIKKGNIDELMYFLHFESLNIRSTEALNCEDFIKELISANFSLAQPAMAKDPLQIFFEESQPSKNIVKNQEITNPNIPKENAKPSNDFQTARSAFKKETRKEEVNSSSDGQGMKKQKFVTPLKKADSEQTDDKADKRLAHFDKRVIELIKSEVKISNFRLWK